VDKLPHATFNDQDAPLEAATKYRQEEIAQKPIRVPKPPN
jgi:hypothetical protein